jgi:hypothetical protein
MTSQSPPHAAAEPAVGVKSRFFHELLAAMLQVHATSQQGQNIPTAAFADMMDTVCRIFDYLGSALYVAKVELLGKTKSLHEAWITAVRTVCHGCSMLHVTRHHAHAR